MADCFCGCGTKVKLTRRALNASGRLIEEQLGAWAALEDQLGQADLWTSEVGGFVDRGSELSSGLAGVVHGGPPQLMPSQREISRWLKTSRGLLARANGALQGTVDGPLLPPGEADEPPEQPAATELDPEARAKREAELASIRASYEQEPDEDDPLQCPHCGSRFDDEQSCVNHILVEHGV